MMKILPERSIQKPVADNSPEVKLLLCCARTNIDPHTSQIIRTLLQKSLDWSYLTHTAVRHGVMPLLYRNLSTICPEAVPKDILTKLKALFQTNAAHNRFLTSSLLQLLNLFEKHDIPVVLFKGPVLAASAYGHLALRQFADLDILFNKQEDVLKARNLLISRGYQNAEQLTYEQEIAQLQSPYVKAYTYKHNELRVIVELHWQLRANYSAFPLDYESLWKRLTSVSLGDTKVSNLSPEDEILYLCAHGSGDRWQKLLQICDIAEALRVHQNLNWQEMLEQAIRLGCQRRLFLGLFLAQKFLEAHLPKEVGQKIQNEPSVRWLVEWVRQRLFLQPQESSQVLKQALFDLVCLERLQDKGNYLRDRSNLLIAKKLRLGFAKKYGLPGGK